ncbi:MAG: hypothetical protein LBV30_10205 [Propionibacteriaceae bacterium]|nr:hypothetical protein [Propionibacteriaceae bacterium]
MITIGQGFAGLFNSYGDWGNAQLLARRLADAGLAAEVTASASDLPDLGTCDIVFIGAATLPTFRRQLDRLLTCGDELRQYSSAGGVLFVTGLPAAALGRSLTYHQQSLGCLQLTDQEFQIHDKRRFTDGVWQLFGSDTDVVGVLNSHLTWTDSATPFLKTSLTAQPGHPRTDGCQQGKLFSSQVIGPLLARNPDLLDKVANMVAGQELASDDQPWMDFEKAAHAQADRYLTEMLSLTEKQRANATGGLKSPTP